MFFFPFLCGVVRLFRTNVFRENSLLERIHFAYCFTASADKKLICNVIFVMKYSEAAVNETKRMVSISKLSIQHVIFETDAVTMYGLSFCRL